MNDKNYSDRIDKTTHNIIVGLYKLKIYQLKRDILELKTQIKNIKNEKSTPNNSKNEK